MSLIMIADDFPPAVGGIQTYAFELALATAELGQQVVVVASAQPGSAAVDAELPFPVVRVPTGGGHPSAAMNLSTGVRMAVRELTAPPRCLVATKWVPEGPAAILAVRALACPIVLLGHGGEFAMSGGNPVKWLVQRAVLRRSAGAQQAVVGLAVGIAIALVLASVFVPVAFLGGIAGQLYRQFALTVAVSVLLSALVALTLTPALCALLLKPRAEGRRAGLLGRLGARLDGGIRMAPR